MCKEQCGVFSYVFISNGNLGNRRDNSSSVTLRWDSGVCALLKCAEASVIVMATDGLAPKRHQDISSNPSDSFTWKSSHQTHGVIITSLLRQNDVATSFWRNNDVIIASRVRWVLHDPHIKVGRSETLRFVCYYRFRLLTPICYFDTSIISYTHEPYHRCHHELSSAIKPLSEPTLTTLYEPMIYKEIAE